MPLPFDYSAFGRASALLCAQTAKDIRAKGQTPTTEDMALAIANLAEATFPQPKPRPAKEVMDGIFDALCAFQGVEPANLTKHGKAAIATARQQIMEVSPAVTGEEIAHRGSIYKRRNNSSNSWTAMGLCKQWADCGGGTKTKAAKLDGYTKTPPEEWKNAAIKLYPGSLVSATPWLDLPYNLRCEILQHCP